MAADVENARRDWADGWRRLHEEARDPQAAARLNRQVEVVTEELRRRVGSTFTLAELATAYADAERWAREAVAQRAAAPGWPQTLAFVGDAAFHLYSRGAVDYRP
jgi:hypothetical protein